MSNDSDKIDELAFGDGRSAFNSGASLRDVWEVVQHAADASDVAGLEVAEVRAMSFALGYADAFVDRVRRGLQPVDVVVEHKGGTVSLLSQVDVVSGVVRARMPGDKFRKTVA